MAEWPWPDDRLTRRTRVAHVYRDALADEAPAACSQIDAAMAHFGQDWILDPQRALDPDALLTVAQIAEVADVTRKAVYSWVYRWPLTSHGVNDAGHRVYRWGDVIDRRRHGSA